MVVVDTNRPEMNYRNLVEEQEVGNVIYRISDSYAPMLGNINKRISITKFDFVIDIFLNFFCSFILHHIKYYSKRKSIVT